MSAAATRMLPAWAEDLRRRYLRGEASIFVLHGNVFDAVVVDDRLLGLTDFLTDVLLRESKETIAVYNVSTGLRFAKREPTVPALGGLPGELASQLTGQLTGQLAAELPRDRALLGLERLVTSGSKTAAIIEYAEMLAPAAEISFQADADRASVVTLHRWSFLPEIEKGDNIVLLITENLPELSPKLVSNPKVGVVEIPMPDLDARRATARIADRKLAAPDVDRYAEVTAGLKAIQIVSILAPPPPSEEDRADREAFIAAILGDGPDVVERAKKLATLTAGMVRDEIRKLLAPGAQPPVADPADGAERAKRDVDRLIAGRKREILERECFGLIEFVTPEHGFDVVGGMEAVKEDLRVVADNMRAGRRSRVPMGILFTGPMGTGKTFVAEAFAKECGLTTIKLKNFRSKWVGATEGNLEKILTVIKAIGPVIVIVDEGDRAFGNTGEEDGGTSSRVIARIKEFMSDTSNRGRILFLVMTNRPDKLDVDLKRAGRLDRKIPFLYPQTPEEVELIVRAQLRKNRIRTVPETLDLAALRERFSAKLVGYSSADIEAVVLMANDDAARASGGETPVTAEFLERAAADYFPSRDVELLEYMELLAVFESSSRRMLPAKYAGMSPEELDARLRLLRAVVGGRR